MKISFLKILLFLSLNNFYSFPQDNLIKQFNFAVKLFEDENYFDAVTEFKRLLFFDEQKEFAYDANIMMGKSYKAGARLNEAISHFVIAEINSRSDEEFYNSRLEVIKANILRRTTNQSLKLLDDLASDKRFLNKINELNYWRGWSFIFADNWENAAAAFSSISREHELAVLSQKTSEEMYSESFAKIISVFIPGAGQFYTGNYFNGIISLGWNIFAGYLTINSFIEDRIFDGLITANLLWLRFYLGGIQNAEAFAEEKNRKISNKILHHLQYEFNGVKP